MFGKWHSLGHIESVEEKAGKNNLDVDYNWDFTINVSWVAFGLFSRGAP